MQALIIALIKEMMKSLFSAGKPTMEDGAKKGKLEERLKDKVKKDGWK
jgi:hypothetical protein